MKKYPKAWKDLLDKIDNNFLRDLLSDIENVETGNMIATDIRIVFKSLDSYNLFNLSLKNQSSRKIIEKAFSETFGDEISIIIDPPENK